jgi:hypothetical protein
MTMVCAYGNCHEELEPKKNFKCTVTESFNGSVNDRQSFCSYEHAWRWLKEHDERLNGSRSLRAHGVQP